jgi:hypothetical protein
VAALAGNLNSSHGTGVILMGEIHFMVHSSAGRADTASSYEQGEDQFPTVIMLPCFTLCHKRDHAR